MSAGPTAPAKLLRAAGLFAVFAVAFAAGPMSTAKAAPLGDLGCLAVQGERVLGAVEPDRRKTPASVQKIAVTVAALHRLGPDFQVQTSALAAGPVTNGTLRGDLVLKAAGDPTWSERFFEGGADEPLGQLARAVRGAGVARVNGDLVIDLSRFPGRPAPPSRSLGDIAFGFAAPTGGVAVAENAVALTMAPGGTVGDPPRFLAPDLEIVNRAHTAPATRDGKGTVDFQAVWDDGRLVIRGEYPISEAPYDIRVAVADGERRAGEAFRRVLLGQGIEIRGDVKLSMRPVPGRILASIQSPPLAEWLPAILGDSNNWLADMLLHVLVAEMLGEGRFGDGANWLETFLVEEVGLEEGAVVLEDASGLSPYNLWTPRAAVELLSWAYRQPWRRTFVDALARPRTGTLKAWPGLPTATRAKTGTLRHSLGLAGYLEGMAEPVVFACFLNHDPGPRPEQRRTFAERLRRWQKLTRE